jgi:hypothetical protein
MPELAGLEMVRDGDGFWRTRDPLKIGKTGEWLRNGQRDLFFQIYEASKLQSVEQFSRNVFALAQNLGYLEELRAAGVRTTDCRAYKTWKQRRKAVLR